MNDSEAFSFVTKENIKLDMNFYRAKDNRKNITILYFHGGGMLYGVRDDLPELYINKFLNAGYDFLALDYPLAPETKLEMILKSAFETLCFYLNNSDKLFDLKRNQYVLFGRSAGAYLCFMLCDMLMKSNCAMPLALISLYGYTKLDEITFNTPSKYYNKLAKVPDEAIEKIISATPVTYAPMNLRFSLYIKARQEGSWIETLCGEEPASNYSLKSENLKSFPPTILAAATLDPDVPYKVTKTLSKQLPNAHLITIYKEAHDFDRDPADGSSAYDEIIQWLETKTE